MKNAAVKVSVQKASTFRILKPLNTEPRAPELVGADASRIPEFLTAGINAVDFETTGLDVREESFRVVGVGIANEAHPDGVYFPLEESDYINCMHLFKHSLIAWNVGYDARCLEVMREKCGEPEKPWPWVGDAKVLYKQLSNEGWAGQRWGLKDAQKNFLGWSETNETDLDEWLIDNGYSRKSAGEVKPIKGEMWRAPAEILGTYCALDAQSTLSCWNEFVKYFKQFPELELLHFKEFNTLAKLEVEAFKHGVYLDKPELIKYRNALIARISAAGEKFLSLTAVAPHIKRFNEAKVDAIIAAEPAKLTKTGKVAAAYLKWEAKVEAARTAQHFNLNSKQQLKWLFYDCLFETSEPRPKLRKGRPVKRQDGSTVLEFDVITESETFTIDTTKSGGKTVDKEILIKLGEPGKALFHYNKLVKELGYVTGTLLSLDEFNVHHPWLTIYGTITGRCSGGSLYTVDGKLESMNPQQQPKVEGYMKCFTARPGNVLLQMDIDALEPVVTAELSRDPSMWTLYGPGAVANDIYLFVLAGIDKFREEITSVGYDPLNPTKDAISATKKAFKGLRAIGKKVHLSSGYGAGAFKIWKDLLLAGVDITLEAVEEVHVGYWQVFAGVKEYEKKLKAVWRDNNGWFIGGRGQPVAVDEKFTKDILNRQIQCTGHINLLTYIMFLDELREQRNLPMFPVIVDLHDETIWECPEERAEECLTAMRDAWDLTNEYLGGDIALSGAPEVCESFATFKIDDYEESEDFKRKWNK